jgi:hypothetical protein
MSDTPPDDSFQELLSAMYSDIVHFVPEDRMTEAEQNFYATRDYFLGDTVSCTAEAALENCEQIKSLMTGNAPRSAIEHIDAVEKEIQRREQLGRPFFAGKMWLLLILGAIAFFVYFVMTFRN